MLKIFLTGDNHFGKKYNRYPDVRERLIRSRYDSLERMVRKAESEGCELFAVTGDLFDNNVSVDKKTVQKTVEILAQFNGTVLVLPGNHDYYTGEEKVWRYFESALNAVDNNIVLLNEFRPYPFSCGGEQVMVYPAFCQSKHSRENNLDWIKEAEISRQGVINIGSAPGAIQGVTPDLKQEYFLMTEKELEAIPMDVWLIGHTHIPYPGDLKEDEDTFGHKIFNAGTHEQTDLSNNSEGLGFIITVRKEGTQANVGARKFISGQIRYFDLKLTVHSHQWETLEKVLTEGIAKEAAWPKEDTVIRVSVSGTVCKEDYDTKERIAKEALDGFLAAEFDGSGLSEEITKERIWQEFAQTSFAARFLERLSDDPVKLQMAYELLQTCRETE